jgi:hypothetical protein
VWRSIADIVGFLALCFLSPVVFFEKRHIIPPIASEVLAGGDAFGFHVCWEESDV